MKKGIEMLFLNDYLDGTVRKRKCHLKGHKYPSHEEQSQVNAPEDVLLNSISDDKWSSDDE